jgi:hypothetical protein
MERLQSDIEKLEKLEEYKDNEKTLKDILRRIPVNSICSIMKHYGITRKSTDKKDDAVFKVIQYFRQLQDPFKCLGNCGFSLEKEFSYCDGCKGNTKKMSVEEKNHLFKENLDIFMENRYELTEEDMYTYNDFCIRSIAEYLGITMFKQKVKGNTKEKMVNIINEHLKEKQKEESKSRQPVKAPDLELNGMMMVCREDGYVNATNLCKAGGKIFSKWYRLESTKELIDVLKSQCPDVGIEFIESKKGGNHSGSWIHPDLAVQLAQWISPMFSLKVSKWVRELALTGSVSLREEKTSTELLQLQKDYMKLEKNHGKLLERRQYHKFNTGAVFYYYK